MHLVSFYIDSRERTCGTQIFAGTTAYTACLVDSRNVGRCLVVGVAGYHLDGADRTVAGAVAAFHTIGQRNTVFLDPYGMTYLGGCLQLMG